MSRVCRTCLKVFETVDEVVKVDVNDEVVQIKRKLKDCVPEVVLERVKDPVICKFCLNTLNAAYAFKLQCQQTELKIHNCLKDLDTSYIDLNIVINQLLSNEAATEESANQKCHKCDKSFATSELLKEHTMSHIVTVHKCNTCDFFTESEPELGEHMQSHQPTIPEHLLNSTNEPKLVHGNEKLYYCSVCTFSSTHQSSIRRHAKIHDKPFNCPECNYQTLDKSDLQTHMNNHTEKQFKCEYCSYFSLKRANLRRHRTRNHPEKIIRKPVEDEEVDNEDPYKVSINDIESFLMEESDSPTSVEQITNMEEDSFTVTVDDIQQILQNGNTETAPTVFNCPTCSEVFKYKYLLRRHLSTHSKDKLYECPECGLRTKTRVHLQGHMKTHGVVYTCDKCDFKSVFWGIVQKHNMLHTGEKPFKCPLCDYRGTHQSTVKYHMSGTHTKPYCCGECSYVTNNEGELFGHMEVHSSQDRIENYEASGSIHDSGLLYNYILQAQVD